MSKEIKKPLHTLYESLKSDNYDVPDTYESFERTLTASGKEGTANRLALYKSLKSDNYDVPDTYASFASTLFAPTSRPQTAQPASAPAPAPRPQATPASTPAPTAQAPTQSAPAPAPQQSRQPAWQPTEQDKIRMSYQMHTMLNDFNQRSKERIAQIQRMAEPFTAEGRKKRKAMEFQAQLAGTPTKVMGLTPPTHAPASDGAQGDVEGAAQPQPVQSGQSPAPYGVKYIDGKPVTEWVMPDGSLTTSLTEADQAEYGARTARLRHEFEDRMKRNGLDPARKEDVEKQRKFDVEDEYSRLQTRIYAEAAPLTAPIVERLWQEAEEKHKADKERNAKKHWDGYAAMGGGREMRIVTTSMNRHDDNISHMTRFDLQKMMDNAWNRAGSKVTANCYNRLRRQYPGASEEELQATASQMARQLTDNAVYQYAVQQNTPKSTLEYFGRKVADMNVINSISKGLARSQAGTSGDLAAYEAAMGEYGKNHRVAQIAGTVTGMAVDPVTWVSGGVGSLAGKGAINIGGRIVAGRAATSMSTQVGSRLFSSSLTGRIITGAAAGGGNFATYEMLKEGESQFLHGGHINPETGENEGYSAGAVLSAGGHGLILGSVTGTLSPVIGNVADKTVKATTSTAGKAGVRFGEVAVSTLAEGTVFSIPEWIKGDADAMDVWTDNMAMMLGFKAQHGLKSAPRVIASLRPVKPVDGRPLTQAERNHNRMDFEERLRRNLDASPSDLSFTADEREELRRAGYGELADLFSRDRVQEATQPNPAEGAIELRAERVEAETISRNPEFAAHAGSELKVDGYSSMEELMQDGNVSQSARAKAYYILTGRRLPMASVTGYTTTTDADGRVTVKSIAADGEVVTSRTFKNEQEAKQETDNIMRQAELNSVDVGERYKEAVADDMVLDAAISEVSPGADPATIKRIYRAVKAGNKDVTESQKQLVEFLDDAMERNRDIADRYRPEAIREALKEETGIDVDAVLRKMPSKRTEAEQDTVKTYLERLFPEEARQQAAEPTPEQAEAQSQYEQGRELYGRFEEGDPTVQADVDAIALRMQEAYQAVEDAFGSEAEYYMFHVNENPWSLVDDPELTVEQKDAVLYYINAKAALDGVMDASNEVADRKRAEVEESVAKRTHKDNGVIIPATMKVDDRQVYIVKGDVVMFPDGTAVDVHNSSESVVVMDAQTGEYQFTSPDQIFQVSEAVNPQDELDTALSVIEQEQMNIFGDNAVAPAESAEGEEPQSVPNSTENPVSDAETTPETVPDAENGQQPVYDDNGFIVPDPADVPIDNSVPARPKQELTALERIPRDAKGEPIFEQAENPEHGWDALVEFAEGDAATAKEIADAMAEEKRKAYEKAQTQKPKGKTPAEMLASKKAITAGLAQAEREYNLWRQMAEKGGSEAGRGTSLAKQDGEAAGERSGAEIARERAMTRQGDGEAGTPQEIQASQEASQEAALDAEREAAEAASREQIGRIDRRLRAAAEEMRECQEALDILEDTAPHDMHEAAAWVLSTNRVLLNDSGTRKGYRGETGYGVSEARRMIGLFASAEKGGVSLARLAEEQMEEVCSENGIAYDNAEAMGALLDVLQSCGTLGQIRSYIRERRLEQARGVYEHWRSMTEMSDEEAAYWEDRAFGEAYHMTVAEYREYEEAMEDMLKELDENFDESEYYGNIADEMAAESRQGEIRSTYYGRELEEESGRGDGGRDEPSARNGSEGAGRVPGRGDEVLPGAGADIAAGAATHVGGQGVRGLDGTERVAAPDALPSGASGGKASGATLTCELSDEVNEFGKPFVKASDGTTDFGFIDEESDLAALPIRLSLGENYKDDRGEDHGYGYLHIDAGHREEILQNGFSSVEEFVETVARNYTDIREGARIGKNQTYLLEVSDEHNNTLFIQLSRDGRYWNVNSAGIFKKKYSRRKPKVYSRPAVGNGTATDAIEVDSGHDQGATAPAGNSSKTSERKDNNSASEKQGKDGESSAGGGRVAPLAIQDGEAGRTRGGSVVQGEVDTEPTEAQKEAGNYRKGHVSVRGMRISIENPRGSIRRGKDADGKEWETEMTLDYGYIRGTTGKDKDHIDIFLSEVATDAAYVEEMGLGSVYVIDQYNKDGSFDEHKVVYGVPDSMQARMAYLENYSEDWADGRRIDVTEVDLDTFKKWAFDGRRKTKPFAEYKSVKAITEEVDQTSTNINAEGMVVDGEDNPLTLYHGTPNDVEALSDLETGHPRKGTDEPARFNGDGVSFTPHRDVAEDYASLGDGNKGKVFEANVTLKNPYYTVGVANFTPEEAAEFTASLKAKGHDGIINYASQSMRQMGTEPNEIIVFDIKNAVPVKTEQADTDVAYSITPTTYTNKKGKTSDVHLVRFNRELTAEEKAALDTFAREPLTEGKKTSRGWYDRKQGGYMMRSEDAARQLAEMIGNEEAVADAQPMTAEELREAVGASRTRNPKPKKAPINRVSLEDVMTDLSTKGETKLSDHAEAIDGRRDNSSPRSEHGAVDDGKHEISDGEMRSLLGEIRDILGIGEDEGDSGIMFRDPGELTQEERMRLQSAGIRVAMGLISRGTTAFPDYATKMVGLLGDKIRPWLKSFYEGARWTPGYEKYAFTPSEEVARFDVQNFDKKQADPIAQAAMIVEERKAGAASSHAQKELTETRNKNRRENDKQTEADTAALAEKAEAVAGEAEAVAGKKDSRRIGEAEEKIDKALDEINSQLAILGHFVDNDPTSKVEARAARAGADLAVRLADDLGLDYGNLPKDRDAVSADFGERGGYVRINLPVRAGYEPIRIDIRFEKTDTGALRLCELVSTMNRGDALSYIVGEDHVEWLSAPRYGELLGTVREQMEKYLPENRPEESHNGYQVGDEVMWDRYGHGRWEKVRIEDFDADGSPIFEAVKGVMSEKGDWSRVKPADGIFGEAQRVARATQEKKKSATHAKKKTEVKPEQPVADLFGGLFDEPISNEKKTDVQSRPGTAERERGHEPQSHEPLGESQRDEVKGTDGRGMGGRSSVNPISDGERGAGVPRKPKSKPVIEPVPESEKKNVRNNHAERGVDYAPKGEDARIKANMEAIELAKRLLDAGETATPEQMTVLRKFSGWGGLGKAFNEQNQTPNPIAKRLKELLGEDGYQDAVDSRRSAYYTPAEVIDTMWDVARAMGFNGGNVLEGSAGIGNIIGLMPADMSERSSIHAVEIDRTTGGILSLLYPDAKVEIQGFEKTRVQNGTVDLAITNVPFITGAKVFDETGDKDLSKKFHDIHDFCIAKNIRKLREGGIGIFITSSGTLDNSKELRLWIIGEGNADVVGAFRMHNKTFGGTGATSDIIVVRKRVNGKPSPNAIDVTDAIGVRVADYDTGDTRKVKGQEIPVIKQYSMMYNKYFAEHPENMAGEMMFNFERGETRFPTSRALFPVKEKEQSKMLAEWAGSFADMEEAATAAPKVEDEITRINEQLGEGVKEGSMVLNSQGGLCMARMGEAVPLGLNKNKVKGHTKAECFKAYSAIKKALSDVLEYQSSNESDEGLAPLLKELNRAFDTFTRTYGNLHKNTAISFLRNDVDFSSILALETYSEKGDKKGNKVVKVGKTDIFSRRVIDTEKEPQPTTIKDAILASLYKSGGVDVKYIGHALGKPTEEVKREIVSSGLGFENPSTGTMEVSYKYLSGNVREKLHIAQENNADGRYDANIKALEGVMPMTIPAHLIEFSLGSSWIEPKLYEDFVFEKTGLRVTLTNAGGTWFMKTPWSTFNEKNRAMAVVSKMCDKTIMGHELIEAAITNRQITVSKTEKHYDGSTETITDKAATAECGTKVDEIRAEFKDWAREHMQADPAMSARIEQTYNDQFNNYVPMSIPDEFVPQHFGGQVSELHGRPFALRPHQGRAVVRGTTEPILLAHEVGTGKTYTLITTAMEMRRLGTARKPMIVVQNATVGQFVESAKEIYPNAKVLTIEEADRTAEGRKNFYAKIKYNDWDMIVVPQSVFERIPDSEEREMAYVKDIIEEKMKVLEAMREADSDGRSMIVRQAERELAEQEARLAELTETMQGKKKKRDEKREATTRQNAEVRALEMLDREVDDVENFDDMGIDAILVDEAHEYKHLGFATAMQRGVKGVDPSYSKKSQGVFLKAQAVMERNNGRNVVFATGTPISNTAAEIWTFMRYLMPVDTMKSYGIYYFDDFVRNFGNIAQMVEFSTNGKFKENNRFAGYVNLPELVRIWSSVADTVLTREAGGVSDKIPDMEGGKPQDIYLPQTRALRSVMKYVKAELDRYDKMTGKEKKENSHIPLTMYGIAKAAAVDVRLVVPNAEDDPNSKTNATVRETLRSLRDSEKYKGTVAIFSDNYQNKQSGFNLYEDIRKKLIAEGVPAEQIVVIKPGMTVKRKLDIFEKVNAGEIRVIMGSTFTLGTGVNIQERLHTLIHVDAPNRPMDYTQRNGRALRQGNLHKDMGIPVRIIRFGVEDSLDVTAYQRLKTKGAIADSIMNGSKMMQNSMENRVLEEEEDSFGDMTAQLSGSEYAILKNQAEREMRNLTAKQKGHDLDQIYVHNQLPKVEGFIKGAERRIEIETKNLEIIGSHFPDGTIKKITIGKLTFDSVAAMEDFFKEQNAKMNEAAENVREGADNYTSKLVVDVDGLKFEVTTTVSRTVDNKGQGTLIFEPERNVTYSCEELGIKDQAIKGNRLKNIMQKIAEDIVTGRESRELLSRGQQQLAHYTEERTQLEQRNGREFPHKQELAEAKERLAKYEEAMKKELAEKEAKYAELDKSVETASDITLTDEDSTDTPTTGDGNKYRLIAERELLDFLDAQPLKKGYRYSQWANMGVLPPMTAKQNGEWRAPMIFSRWEQSEEGMRKENGKADLVQGNGRTTGDVAYNPYFHIRTSPLNDQFTAAYDRPELLVVEGYYPESEETSGYQAEGAKDSVGLMDWHSGSVNGQLSDDTKVQTMLSRYFKPGRIVPWSEVADLIMERVGDQKITFPINAVPPMLRAELAKRGAKFGDISGSVAEADIPMLNELRNRVNAGEWDAGLEKACAYLDAYESSAEAKEARVADLSARANTPVRIVRTQEEADALPTRRERRAKGWWSTKDDEVVIVLPNNVNVADVDNTFVHEVVGHKGLRALIGEERLGEFLDEVYGHASEGIRKRILRETDRMVNEEADRLRVRKAQGHERAGEDVNANYYTDMAEARVEAERRREEFRREATEEYMADLGGRIGSEGFEKMSRDELTLWGRIKAKVQAFLDKFLRGLKIAKSIRLTDKDLAYILYKSWKNLRERGSSLRSGHDGGGVFAAAEDAVMRMRTGYGEPGLRPMTSAEKEAARAESVADRIEGLFDEAVSGKLTGKPVEVGRLTADGKEYLERLSGMKLKDEVSFVLNPSDLMHMYRDHFGDNEKDKGNNIPLSKDDIRAIAKVVAHPEKVVFGTEPGGLHRKMFYFLSPGDAGTYNLLEVYSDRKGNLTTKTFYKTRKAVSQRVLSLMKSEHLTSATDGASLSDGAKLPKFFEYPTTDGEEKLMFRDGEPGFEEYITKMKAEAMQANAGNLQAKREAMRAIGGNLNHLRQAMARQREYDITTVKSVADLARVLMDNNLLDDLSKYETKRILGAINNVVGKQDVSQYVQKVMDIMVDNQLRMGANTLGRLLSIRGSRVDARGIEVQGELDPDGQRIAQVVRKSTSLPKEIRDANGVLQSGCIEYMLREAINRMSSTDQAIADEATIEYAGLQIARQYVEDITESKAEEKALRDSIREAKEAKDAGQMTDDAYRQYVESTEDAIRQNKIERAEAFHSLVEQVGGVLSESVERAKAWREAEKQRVEEIHHNANSDMEGRPTDEHHKDDRMQKMANNSFARFLLSPLATFDQMLRMFGKKNSRGEGYLWNRYMRDWVTATEKEYTGYRDALKVLDAKVSEIYGKDMTWGDLFTIDRKLPKASVRFFDGGEMKDHELTQGNLLYIYMADKMSDGRMKLRRMGITEEDIEDIKNFLDPKFMQLADWMQEEFLVDKRNEYNEVHKRMFGASMAAIENYFPLKILANARLEDVDVADDTTDTALPATSTGSIIKRRRNNLALDVTGANAFSVILDHLQQMERWAAFAEFNRDLNTLLSYKRFRNQVMNMSSVYGAGKTLWNNFRNVCSMAAGAYRPPIAALDKSAVNIAKGVTAAKVSFRVFTALKQFLSMPAYASDSNPLYIAANIANPIGAWRWSMENLPLFEKRWRSRMAGDPRLLKSEMDWKMWRSRVVELASRVGMAPNAFVDALTVAIGAHAMYQTKLAKYKRMGYDPDVAEERAKQDATILFNQTQQSSEGAFLSTMQVDRSWLSVLFTVFRNSSMSYTRQLYDSIRNIGCRLTPGYKALSEEFMAKQMRRDGIDPDKADRNAKQEYRRGIIRDLVRVGIFGYVLQLAWNLSAYLPYLIFGDDDDEKDKMWDDVFTHTMFGSIEGLTGGDVYSNTLNTLAKGEELTGWVASKDMPASSDLENIWTKWNTDEVSAMNDVINLLVQSAVGVNPQSLTDAVVAVMDVCGDDAQTSRECALLMARVINCPQSQLDKIYFDELGSTGEEASQMTPYEIAERYARYKVRRGAPLTGWAYDNEQREKIMDKYRKKSNTLAKERLTRETDTQASPNMTQWLEEFEATKDRVSDIKKVKSRDEDRYYELLDELEATPEFSRYEIIRAYKHDVDELTKEWLNATMPAQRDSCAQAMLTLKREMVRELEAAQQ